MYIQVSFDANVLVRQIARPITQSPAIFYNLLDTWMVNVGKSAPVAPGDFDQKVKTTRSGREDVYEVHKGDY